MFFSSQYDNASFEDAGAHDITFLPHRLDSATTVLASGYDAVCIFVNDLCDAETLQALHELGVKVIALRVRYPLRLVELHVLTRLRFFGQCAGFNNVRTMRILWLRCEN